MELWAALAVGTAVDAVLISRLCAARLWSSRGHAVARGATLSGDGAAVTPGDRCLADRGLLGHRKHPVTCGNDPPPPTVKNSPVPNASRAEAETLVCRFVKTRHVVQRQAGAVYCTSSSSIRVEGNESPVQPLAGCVTLGI